jgi:uncharacterized protein YjlB
MLLMSTSKGNMRSHLIKDDGTFPNNNLLPVIIYKSAVELPDTDPASNLETIFKVNSWQNAWRNGIYDYHHYHSTAHEVLGVYQGNVKLQLGGPEGITEELETGDVVIIPAGVAHKNIGSTPDFKCVGAYPAGQDYDTNYGKPGERPEADNNIRNLPLPVKDPVFGADGPMIASWSD